MLMGERSKRVGVLGGSFNPVHLGHLHIAKELKSRCQLDEVWFIPAYQNPHKMNQSVVSGVHRLEMLKLAIQDYASYKVMDIECKRKGPSYTIDTLRLLREQHPENEYLLILGSDAIKRFHEWNSPHEILKLCTLVVASREKEGISINYDDNKLERSVREAIISTPLLKVSSTEIRSLAERGESYQSLVPAPVFEYMQQNKLYTQPE